jgi:methyl-accepting chemotaxis protein
MFSKRRERESQQLKERITALEQMVQGLTDLRGAVWLDATGKVTRANQRFLTMLGYEQDQIVGHHLRELVPEHVGSDFHQAIRQSLAQGTSFDGLIRLKTKAGEEAWLDCISLPLKAPSGTLEGFVQVFKDVTAPVEKSSEQESFIEALSRSSAVIEFTLDGRVITANDRFLAAMRYRLEDIKGKHHRMFCTPAEANSPAYQAFWERLRRGGVRCRPIRADRQFRSADLAGSFLQPGHRFIWSARQGRQVRHSHHRPGTARRSGRRRGEYRL